MATYTKTGPFSNNSAPGISASFLNAVETCLVSLCDISQREATQTEVGRYFLAGWSSGAAQNISWYYPSLSRGTSLVSVSIDQSDQGAVTCNAPTTAHLTSSGFQVYTQSTGSGNPAVGGQVTLQY